MLCVALAGCSALRLAYQQAPSIVYWWLDGYADLDEPQSDQARRAIDAWFDWHRRTQLPDYVALLARAQADVRQDTTPERACRWWHELRRRGDAAIAQALPDVAAIATTLTPAQIEHVKRGFDKSNRKFRDEYLEPDRQLRRERALQRNVERIEMLYGRLEEPQRELLAQRLAASPFDPEAWLAERKLRQRDALELLVRIRSDGLSKEQALPLLRAHVGTWSRSPREAWRRYDEQLEAYNCRLAAALHNTTSPAQREAAGAKLKNWEGDLRSLISPS